MILRQWYRKKYIFYGVALLMVLVFFTSGTREYNIGATIRKTKPEVVWEYVADFSKTRALNPTVLSFRVISDTGHTHDWRYTVEYSERMFHWPYFLNKAKAEYIVTKSMPGEEDPKYTIESKHTTCFFTEFYCLISYSEFTCRADGDDTYCEEHIEYQCPPFLHFFCRKELEQQRQTVMHNLTTIFSKNE
ncbi:uncharacterized protein LOC105220964 [Zeugodacus cucurbitae]|uniref:uncharacterized protein LOC105220964 n=1 Tax=Zeugodacus cucurbitae TaxID=28588 RepID=UPI0005967B91|nr:uncharacterized protein LOC105220964 [Zeugodacus cucurbitae]